MLRSLRLVFLVVTGLVLLIIALSNRAPVPLRLVPPDLAGFLDVAGAWELPLFLIILGSVAFGVLIGFVWEWFRERGMRGENRTRLREVARLERELAVLRDDKDQPRDEVLALIENGRR
ncbi:MAG: LapA family protein [Paracoccaceae bacterium]